MLTRLIVVIIFQYIQILNHYVVYLKLIECYISIKKERERERERPEVPWELDPGDRGKGWR